MAEGAHPAATIPRTAIQDDGAHPQLTKRALADKCRAGEAGGGQVVAKGSGEWSEAKEKGGVGSG